MSDIDGAACAHLPRRLEPVVVHIGDDVVAIAYEAGDGHCHDADRTRLEETTKDLGMREGFDVGLEMSGNPTALRDLLRAMNHGGGVALLGIPPEPTAVDWNQVIFKGLVLKGIYGREMFETWYKMASLLQSGLDLAPVIPHEFPLRDYERAFQAMGSGLSGKVVLDWTSL